MTADARPSYTARVRAYLTSRPLEWVITDVLRGIGGKDGWRTRVSVARRALIAEGLGTITNRLVYIRNADGAIIRTDSYYRFEPAQDTATTFVPSSGMPVYHGTYQRAPKAVRVDPAEDAQGELFA